MSALALILTAGTALCLLFAAAYLFARRVDNYGVVDVVWSYAFAGVAVFYGLAASGALPRRMTILLLAVIWSLRLGTHLARRVRRHHPAEDARYRQLRRDWSGRFGPKMFGFFQLQAISVVALATPFLLVAQNPAPRLHPLEYAAILLWLIAIAGEALADAQLAEFQRDPRHRDRVCRAGLWRFSRHPNYFFEWLVWVAFALFALPSPWGAAGLLAPATMLYLLLRVTGIPATEAQSLRRKGEAYRAYQRTTNAFVPWFPRNESGSKLP
jgi:steroid 5-alpha reductase family enzyme